MSARDAVSPVQFGFLRDNGSRAPASERIPPEYHDKDMDLHGLPLRATQTKMSRKTVASYASSAHPQGYGDVIGRLPEVIEYKGERVVWDGHHRIAAALARGDTNMKVRYADTTPGHRA